MAMSEEYNYVKEGIIHWDKLRVTVKEYSFYPFDLEKKPTDFYNKKRYEVYYEDKLGRRISFNIRGNSRQEQIKLFINEQPFQWDDKCKILSFGEQALSLSVENQDLRLNASVDLINTTLNHLESRDNLFITPYIPLIYKDYKIEDLNMLKHISQLEEEAKKIIEPYIKTLLQHSGHSLIVPIAKNFYTQYFHWYLLILDFKDNAVEARIVESLNQIRDTSLKKIQADLHKSDIGLINDLLKKYNIPGIAPKEILYSQSLQYGVSGCWFATAGNLEKIITTGNLPVFTAEDQTESYTIYYEDRNGGNYSKKLTLDEYERIIYDLEYIEVLGIKPAKSHFKRDQILINDKSLRYDIISEGLSRVSICLTLFDKEQKCKNELQSDVINQMKLSFFFRKQRTIMDVEEIKKMTSPSPHC